jgi:carbamoyl-phosphate synthase large subunit
MKVNVLITGIGSTTALSVIKGLRKQNEFDVFIVGTDVNDERNIAGSHFCDKFFKVPSAEREEEYINSLINIIKSESINLVIPIVDTELEVIAKYGDLIERFSYLLLSSYGTIITCNDKFKTYEFFNKFGIPTLNTVLVERLSDIENLLSNSSMKYPVIVKPRKGVSSRDIYEIQNRDELFLIKRVKDPIVQEKGTGQEYTIDVFCDAEKLISAVPRKRIETKAGISYKGKTEKDDKLIDYAREITEKLKIKGPANIQCFKNGDEIKFTEINPRFSGGLPLTIAAGVNTPLFALKMAVGEKLEPVNDFKIVKMCRYWEEVFYYED